MAGIYWYALSMLAPAYPQVECGKQADKQNAGVLQILFNSLQKSFHLWIGYGLPAKVKICFGTAA